MNFLRHQLLLFTTIIGFSTFSQAEVIDKALVQQKQPWTQALLQKVRETAKVPYYFKVPYHSFSNFKKNENDQNPLPIVAINHREEDSGPASQVGLRFFAVDNSKSRVSIAEALAQSGLIQTGDIILTYRPEWYGSLRYSHIQLGVSHATLALVKTNASGKLSAFNIDLPFNDDFMGTDRKSQFSSPHFMEARGVHILRLKGLSPEQRQRLQAWGQLMLTNGNKVYGRNLSFNTDYSAPKFDGTYNFIPHIARIVRGENVRSTSMYCSEFAYSMLSLRDCDPRTESFSAEGRTSCINPPFLPQPVMGDYQLSSNSNKAGLSIGMVDGIAMLADAMTDGDIKTRNAQIEKVFTDASGQPEKISQGHRAVEEALLKSNPAFYQMLQQYYLMLPQKENPEVLKKLKMIQQGFNASQKPNYSPTSFVINTISPEDSAMNAFEYVGTVAYLPHDLFDRLLYTIQTSGEKKE